jgi:cytosine/adenosine deaminase-related metal-dependent hydrolase
MPGLINAHFHSSGNLMKGALPGLPLELFMLYEVPPLAAGGDAARLAYVRTALGAMEMLRRGVTAVHDDAYHVPVASREGIDAILQAYADAGIRASVAIDQPTVVEYEKYPWLAELLPDAERRAMEAAPRQSPEELLELYAHLIERWHGRSGGRLGAAVSCSAPQRVTPDYLHALSSLARKHDLPFNIHLLETRLQRVFGDMKYGKSLVRYVHDLGVLDEHVMAIHAIWIDERDAALLAASGCTVAHNPVCNLRLGSGVMPWKMLRDAGVPVCLGSDEMNTDDTVNLWFVAKTAALLQTLAGAEYRDWPAGPEMLAALTAGGARALRKAGTLGKLRRGSGAARSRHRRVHAAQRPAPPARILRGRQLGAHHGGRRPRGLRGRARHHFGRKGAARRGARADAGLWGDAGAHYARGAAPRALLPRNVFQGGGRRCRHAPPPALI